ncbi:MAG: type II and III secretion system protein family protein [Beijerinckiaceae bacterium]|nr:type II and III secretion system protein family protein [Beijerinckiaceae bacterium]
MALALVAAAGVLACALAFAPSAFAQGSARDGAMGSEGRLGRVVVPVGHSRSFRIPAAYSDVIVGAAEIADVVPVSDRAVYILGKQIGTTNIAISDANKRVIGVLDVEVTPDHEFIQSRIRQAVPAARNVRVSSAAGTLVLSGSVSDGPTAERAVAIAAAFTKTPVVNALQVSSPQQVMLEVRVIELARSAGRELGISLDGTGKGNSGYRLLTGLAQASSSTPFGILFSNLFRNSSVNVDIIIKALEEKGLARRLANPNLTALSGATANFQAGGEYPYPITGTIPSNGGTSVATTTYQFKKYGVMIDFTPTVLDNGTINLRVTPEVSDLDFTTPGSVPSIIVRRAQTEVMLKNGQSFAVAGLLQENNRIETAQLPWIGSMPVLGALFRSQSYQKKETELVIIVTTHLARPAAPGDKIATPLDKTIPPNDVDLFVEGKFELLKDYRNYVERGVGVVGPYGHVIQVAPGGVVPLSTRF